MISVIFRWLRVENQYDGRLDLSFWQNRNQVLNKAIEILEKQSK